MRMAVLAGGVVVLGAMSACSGDQITAPAASAPGLTAPALFGKSGGGKEKLNTLDRDSDMPGTSKSITVDAKGGKLEIKDYGFKLTIPKNAVLFKTTITVTALPGEQVAYEFEPHGTIFLQPLVIEQEIEGTKGKGKSTASWVGGYFSSLSQLLPGVGALVEEVMPVEVRDGKVSLKIWHFSGYLMSTGKSAPVEEPDSPM